MPEKNKQSTNQQKPAQSTQQVILATGKRKSAIAQVKLLSPGRGQIFVNKKMLNQYFPYFEWQKIVEQPLDLVNQKDKIDIVAKLSGGGVRAQAEALRLGISKSLIQFNPDFRKILKPKGLLTRDSRKKERKKPGLKRARRAPQWQKR